MLSWIYCSLLPSLFLSISTISAATIVFTIALGKTVIRRLQSSNFLDQIAKEHCGKLEALHKDKAHVPTGGGILLFLVFLMALIVWMPWFRLTTWIMLVLACCWCGLGWYDDTIKNKKKKGHGLKAKHKFFIQVCIAIATLAVLPKVYGSTQPLFTLQIPFYSNYVQFHSFLGKIFCLGLAVVAIVGTCNAVNITDGLDGLAAGSFCFASLGLLLVALYRPMAPEITLEVLIVLATLIGMGAGFLWYNSFPAQVFMGDTGSLLLGGLLGCCAVIMRAEIFLVIFGGVFVVEAGSVILQVLSCKLRKKRIFLCSPLHHHFEYKGVPEPKIVQRFWLFGGFCVFVGVVALFWGY